MTRSRSGQFLYVALDELYQRAAEEGVPVDRWVMVICDLEGETADGTDVGFGDALRAATPWAPVQARIDPGRLVLLTRDLAAGVTAQAALEAARSHPGRVRISLHSLPPSLEDAWQAVSGRPVARRVDLKSSEGGSRPRP